MPNYGATDPAGSRSGAPPTEDRTSTSNNTGPLGTYFLKGWSTLTAAAKSTLCHPENVVPFLCFLLAVGGFVAILFGLIGKHKKWRSLLQPALTFVGIFIAIASQWILAQKARRQENTFALIKEWHEPKMHKIRKVVYALWKKYKDDRTDQTEVEGTPCVGNSTQAVGTEAKREECYEDSELTDQTEVGGTPWVGNSTQAVGTEAKREECYVDSELTDQLDGIWTLLHFFEKWAVYEFCEALDNDLAEKALGNYAKWFYEHVFKVNTKTGDNHKSLLKRIKDGEIEVPESLRVFADKLEKGHTSLLKLVREFTKLKGNRRDDITRYFEGFKEEDTTTTINN